MDWMEGMDWMDFGLDGHGLDGGMDRMDRMDRMDLGLDGHGLMEGWTVWTGWTGWTLDWMDMD